MTQRSSRPGPSAIAVAFLFLAVPLLTARLACAHAIGLSRGEYRVLGAAIEARLVFDRDELAAVLDGRTAIAPGGDVLESDAGRGELERRIIRPIQIADRGGRPCLGTLRQLSFTADGGVVLDAVYACAGAPNTSLVAVDFWDELTPGHRHLASGNGAEQILYRAAPRFGLAPLAAPPSLSPLAWVELGVEHILTGYDHLLFLLALLIVTPTLRTILATATLFTLAHSVTLALSTLRVFAPPPGLVECAIALSIAYVGLENLTPRGERPRYPIVFAFGLIHGFGFAGALAELGLPEARTPAALFAFNVGVELGQLAVLAVAFPIIQLFRRIAWFGPRGVPALSLGTAIAGVFWFFDRL